MLQSVSATSVHLQIAYSCWERIEVFSLTKHLVVMVSNLRVE